MKALYKNNIYHKDTSSDWQEVIIQQKPSKRTVFFRKALYEDHEALYLDFPKALYKICFQQIFPSQFFLNHICMALEEDNRLYHPLLPNIFGNGKLCLDTFWKETQCFFSLKELIQETFIYIQDTIYTEAWLYKEVATNFRKLMLKEGKARLIHPISNDDWVSKWPLTDDGLLDCSSYREIEVDEFR